MDKKHYILSLDQGTTGTTALLLDFSTQEHKILSQKTIQFKQYYPEQDWVEHDLEEVWLSCLKAINHVIEDSEQKISSFKAKAIKAISITNQRETLCIFSKKTGKPIHPGIVWQCKRSIALCKKLKEADLEKTIREKTGLFLDPYFTGTKISWLMENNSSVRKKILSGEALIGTIDTYLLYRLTGCSSFFY